MTEKLYYKDAYIKNFTAAVLSCEKKDETYDVVLDKTAFFPEEGGQYADRGILGGAQVINVCEADGIIHHTTDVYLEVGSMVLGEIDFNERFEKMQCHTAEHILSGLFHSVHGLDNVGFHLGAEDVTMDISRPLSWDALTDIERKANEIVFMNVEVCQLFPAPSELSSLEYRAKLDLTDNVRIVKIGDYDSCACCAPHVNRTGEIGSIKILDAEKLRGGMRIHITAGRRAYNTYKKMYENLAQISKALSVPRLNTAAAAAKLLSDYEQKKAECKSARLMLFEMKAAQIQKCNSNTVIVYNDASVDELRAVANIAIEKVLGILVLLSGSEGDYKYVIASKTTDLKEQIKTINAALGGKGGGTAEMVQGSFHASYRDIEKYFT